jgi:hypothetical protein
MASGPTARTIALSLAFATVPFAESLAVQVRVEVDPVVVQGVRMYATNEFVRSLPVIDLRQESFPCTVEQTCFVQELLNIRIVNQGSEMVIYRSRCSPIQRQWEGEWVGLWPPRGQFAEPGQRYACAAIYEEEPIPAGGEISLTFGIHEPPHYDWRSLNEDLRVVVDVRDSAGNFFPPVTSQLFRVRDR